MKKLLNIFLLILSFNLLSLSLSAQYHIIDNDKTLNKKEMSELEKVISAQKKFYNKALSERSIEDNEVKLKIYTDYGNYLLYQKENTNQTLHRSMGFYSPKNKEAVVCKDKNEKRFLSICFHELSHFFINTYFQSIPVWLNEGLAVYFGSAKVSSKNISYPLDKYYLGRVKTMIETRDIDLQDFLLWNSKKFYKQSFSHDNYGYALGYVITLFLMEQEENHIIELLQYYNKGKTGSDAFDSSYKGGFNQFEIDFFKFVMKS